MNLFLILFLLLFSIELIGGVTNLHLNQSSDIVLVSETGIDDSDAVSAAIDNSGNVHIVWSECGNYGDSGFDCDILYRKLDTQFSNWGDIEIVSSLSTNDSKNPRIAVGNSGNIHVVWQEHSDMLSSGPDEDIFYRMWSDFTKLWENIELVSLRNVDSRNPDISIDAQDEVNIVWTDMTKTSGESGMVYYRKYAFQAEIWNDPVLVSVNSLNGASYPSIVMDELIDPHVVWSDTSDISGSGSDSDIYYSFIERTILQDRMIDQEVNWAPMSLLSENSSIDSLYPVIDMDDSNNLHVVWSEVIEDKETLGRVFYGQKFDNDDWKINELFETDQYVGRTSIDVDNNYKLHLLWESDTNLEYGCFDNSTNRELVYHLTVDDIVFNFWGRSSFPNIIVNPTNTPHILWSNQESVNNKRKIYYQLLSPEFISINADSQIPFVSQNDPNINPSSVIWVVLGLITLIGTGSWYLSNKMRSSKIKVEEKFSSHNDRNVPLNVNNQRAQPVSPKSQLKSSTKQDIIKIPKITVEGLGEFNSCCNNVARLLENYCGTCGRAIPQKLLDYYKKLI